MPDFIPLQPSDTNYRLRVPLGNELYLFDVRWNSRDAAFYIDLYEQDETPIVLGAKLVLGCNIGRQSTHRFFGEHLLKMVDTSGQGIDAGYDDIGTRVCLLHYTTAEILDMGTESN